MTPIVRHARTVACWLFPWTLLQTAGCGGDEPTAIAGKAIVTIDDREYVLDSGRDGQRPITVDDDGWFVQCYEYYGDVQMIFGGPSEFDHIRLVTVVESEREPRYVGVEVIINYQRYTGHCTGSLKGDIYASPNKVDISAEPCELPYGPEEGAHARLDHASFHVTRCRPLVPPTPDDGLDAGADAQ